MPGGGHNMRAHGRAEYSLACMHECRRRRPGTKSTVYVQCPPSGCPPAPALPWLGPATGRGKAGRQGRHECAGHAIGCPLHPRLTATTARMQSPHAPMARSKQVGLPAYISLLQLELLVLLSLPASPINCSRGASSSNLKYRISKEGCEPPHQLAGAPTHQAPRWGCSRAGCESRKCRMHASGGPLNWNQTRPHPHWTTAGTLHLRIRMPAQRWGMHPVRQRQPGELGVSGPGPAAAACTRELVRACCCARCRKAQQVTQCA